MTKSADAFRTISEVAAELAVPKHVLRFWENKFPQIRPMKRGGGRRYYRPEDLALLRGIQHLLHSDGYTIKGVQKILREQGIEQVKRAALETGAAGAAAGSGQGTASSPVAPAKKKAGAGKPGGDGNAAATKRGTGKVGPGAGLNDRQAQLLRTAIDELEAARGVLADRPKAGKSKTAAKKRA